MQIEVLKSKIHRVRVTQAELNYVGSITLDEDLIDAANMIVNEKVAVVNVNNGERFATYAIPGERGSGTISLNGAAARLAQLGDLLIICTYGSMNDEEIATYVPKVAFVDAKNNITGMKGDTHGS